MTILVAYVSRPEGRAALEKGIELAKHFDEDLLVMNASAGTTVDDGSIPSGSDVEEIKMLMTTSGIKSEFKQFIRGKTVVEEIEALVASMQVSMVIVGLGKRTAIGKLLLGSVAQEILLSVSSPVLAIKAR
jgi:nucleotide-binding universal stress UspA family protein